MLSYKSDLCCWCRERTEEFVIRAYKGGIKKATHKSTADFFQRYLSIKQSLLPKRLLNLNKKFNHVYICKHGYQKPWSAQLQLDIWKKWARCKISVCWNSANLSPILLRLFGHLRDKLLKIASILEKCGLLNFKVKLPLNYLHMHYFLLSQCACKLD